MKKLRFLLPLLLAAAANAQVINNNVNQSGTATANDIATWANNGVIQDGGSSGSIVATGVTNIKTLQLNSNDVPLIPGGRLTLSSTAAVPTADLTAQSTIYYLPYTSQLIPIYNGSHWQEQPIAATGVLLGLGSTNMPSTEVFDVYAVNVSNTVTLCAMYWGSNTSRSSTAGGKSGTADARITQLNGIWVNRTAIATANCYGGASGTTAVVIPQNQGTLLGSFYTTGNGQTGTAFKPSAAAGGSNNVVGISNAYNRIMQSALTRDSATGVQAASTSFTQWGAGNNRISWVDTLQLSPITGHVSTVGGDGTSADCAAIGMVLDATTGTPGVIGQGCSNGTIAQAYTTLAPTEVFYPQLGLHFIAPTIAALVGGTATFTPVAGENGLTVDIQW